MIVRLSGGLGNQMFQYAMGRAICMEKQEPLLIDTFGFKRDPLRKYALAGYPIKAKILNGPRKIWYNALFFLNRKLHFIPKGKKRFGIYFEREWFVYEELVENTAKFFEGCWQNTKYFEKELSHIREELNGVVQLPKFLYDLKNEMEECDSVSLHVRHGDYQSVNNQKTYKIISLQYYQNAMRYVEKKIDHPVFYVFTDDVIWCREIFGNNPSCVIVSDLIDNLNSQQCKVTDSNELTLMQTCKHHIIANSSFSFWGAFLGKEEGSIWIAPKTWFVKEQTNEIVKESILQRFLLFDSDF